MASKTNVFETGWLTLLFHNTAFEGVGDAGGLQASASDGSFYLSLHTSNPGETANQTTNEASFPGYSRVAVTRVASSWTITNNLVQNAAAIQFAECTSGSQSITHFGVGTESSGTGKLLYYGPLGNISLGAFTVLATAFTVPGLTGLSVDDRATVYETLNTDFPVELTAGQLYWVIAVNGNTLALSETQGGPPLSCTAGGGFIFRTIQITVSEGSIVQFAANSLNILED